MSCCTATYDLGCHNHCSTIEFGEATATATLTAVYSFAGIDVSQSISTVIGQPYELDLSGLNEQATYTVKLYNANGTEHTVTIGETEYDCFTFKTRIYLGATPVENTNTTRCCDPTIIEVDGEETYTLLAADWADYGAIPEIQVVVKIDGVYQNLAFSQSYDAMPNPTEITITLAGTPPDVWYIILK